MNEELQGFQSVVDAEGNLGEKWYEQDFVKEFYGDGYDNDVKTLSQFKTLPDILKSYANTKKLVGANTVAVPKADAPEEKWNEFYTKVGRPESPEKYSVKYDGVEISEQDKSEWQKQFHKLGLNDKQVQGLIDHLGESNKKFRETLEAEAAQERKTATEKLRAMPNYNELMLAKDRVVNKFDKRGVLEQMGILDEPEVLEILGRIGDAMSEDTLAMGRPSSDSDATLKAQIQELENDPAFLDRNNPKHKQVVEKRHTLFMRLHE